LSWDFGEVFINDSQYRGGPSNLYLDQFAIKNYITRGMIVGNWHNFFIGAGPSYMTSAFPYNGEGFNFALFGGFKIDDVVIQYDHFSDAGITKRNLGRDLLMIGWRF
ncbi:MAG: hypothetical protein ACRDFB_04960, partial [Rhabdochlamydiaceae bacterium]